MLSNFWGGLKAFYAKPYNEDGNALDWALFLGFVAIMGFLWSRVIKDVLG